MQYFSGLDFNSNLEFEDNLETAIHEVTHVLGFSGGLY